MVETSRAPERILHLQLMACFELRLGPRAIELRSKKARALLAYVALMRRGARRESVADLLWETSGAAQTAHSLRQCLWTVRRALEAAGGPDPFHADGDLLRLSPCVEVDVHALERLTTGDDDALLAPGGGPSPGPLLPDLVIGESAFDAWLGVERIRVGRLADEILRRTAAAHRRAGRVDDAIAVTQRRLAIEPACEDAHRELMRLYSDAGRRAEAVRQFEACSDALAHQLDTTPDAETRALRASLSRPEAPAPCGVPFEVARPRERPGIVVLPPKTIHGAPGDEALSAGLLEDITTELSRFRSLAVTARTSAVAVAAEQVDVHQIARRLGVDYALEGSLRRIGSQLRVTMQLITTATGEHVWAERYDQDADSLHRCSDALVRTIVACVAGRVEVDRARLAARLELPALSAYEAILRGKLHQHRYTLDDNAAAIALFEHAVRVEPGLAAARAFLACGWVQRGMMTFDRTCLERARRQVCEALRLDPDELECHRVSAAAALYDGRFADAEHHQQRALSLNPNDERVLAQHGQLMTSLGDPEEGARWVRAAMGANPFHSSRLWHYLARSQLLLDDLDGARHSLAQDRGAGSPVTAYRALCFAAEAREDEARRLGQGLRAAGAPAGSVLLTEPVADREAQARMRRWLEIAGLG